MDIVINYDSVEIEGQVLSKPPFVGSKDWMEFWEDVEAMPAMKDALHDLHHKIQDLEADLEDAKREIKALQEE